MHSHLKPGVGHLEQVEIDLTPRCDDGTLPNPSNWRDWYNYLTDATQRNLRPIAWDHNTPRIIQDMGFVDVRVQRLRLPVGEWSHFPGEIDIGRYWRACLDEAIEPLSLAVFRRQFDWPIESIREYIKCVRAIVCDYRIHAYNDL